jgi:hypothetical protein
MPIQHESTDTGIPIAFVKAVQQTRSPERKTDMALTQMQSRCSQRSLPQAKVKVRPLASRPISSVPEATVKEMVREIAFVLQITRRLSKEIRKAKTCAEADRG